MYGQRSTDIASGATVHVVKAAANSLQADVGQPARSPAAAGPGGGGIPSLASMQQRLQANPEMMRQMLNSPITDVREARLKSAPPQTEADRMRTAAPLFP